VIAYCVRRYGTRVIPVYSAGRHTEGALNARRLKLIVAVALAVASSTWAGRAEATVVSFDSMTRAPSDMLVIDGVTIAPTPWGVDAVEGQVATVEGIGLGTTGLLSPGFIDRFDSYYGDCSSTGLCHGYDSAVRLSVNGRINSVTLRLYQTLDGPPKNPEDHCCAFEWAFFTNSPGSPGGVSYELHTDKDPPLRTVALFGGSYVEFGVFSDFGEFLYQFTYLQNHSPAPATFTYGLSIVSLDYTPDPVPEASTVALLGAGLLHVVRRRRTARAPA